MYVCIYILSRTRDMQFKALCFDLILRDSSIVRLPWRRIFDLCMGTMSFQYREYFAYQVIDVLVTCHPNVCVCVFIHLRVHVHIGHRPMIRVNNIIPAYNHHRRRLIDRHVFLGNILKIY